MIKCYIQDILLRTICVFISVGGRASAREFGKSAKWSEEPGKRSMRQEPGGNWKNLARFPVCYSLPCAQTWLAGSQVWLAGS